MDPGPDHRRKLGQSLAVVSTRMYLSICRHEVSLGFGMSGSARYTILPALPKSGLLGFYPMRPRSFVLSFSTQYAVDGHCKEDLTLGTAIGLGLEVAANSFEFSRGVIAVEFVSCVFLPPPPPCE